MYYHVPAQGTTFVSGSTNVIRIPLNGPFFLNGPDSYLKANVHISDVPASADGAFLDSSSASLIQRLRTYSYTFI